MKKLLKTALCLMAVVLCMTAFLLPAYAQASDGEAAAAQEPAVTEEKASAYGAELVERDEAIERADILSLNLPLNAETAGSSRGSSRT